MGLVTVLSVSEAQAPLQREDAHVDEYGTCATTIIAPFGAAFIIDSRVTDTTADGKIVGQHTGCKALLARPSILLAGVRLSDTTGNSGHWNALDEAAAALQRLPENPTEAQLAYEWGQT